MQSSVEHAVTTALVQPASMPAPLDATRFDIDDSRTGRFTCYAAGPATSDMPPLLLVHSVNAAASAYEMRPLFEHYRQLRPTYALDLPGFGLSDRSERPYTPRLMTDAVRLAVEEVRRRHGDARIDMMALSLGCEFAARAANESPNAFRSLALISPTGMDKRTERAAQAAGGREATRAMPWLLSIFTFPLWKRGFFSALTSRRSIRFFLQKTFGSKSIDEGLLEYDYISTHQPGAENAPYYFVSGYMFSLKAIDLYRNLAMPVFMAHGVRGDFTDYDGKRAVAGQPNWTIQVFDTGAMPQFELPNRFVMFYEDFLRQKVAGGEAQKQVATASGA